MGILDNEVSSLRYGIYNLGFLGIRADSEGRAFANWWAQRCIDYCYDDLPLGLFVDQKWCDLIPAFFDNVRVVRDPGYNVASWNLSTRHISIERDGQILVNGSPLRFFHFTKLGPIGDVMTQRYARDNVDVYEIWAWYKRQVERYAESNIPLHWWKYGEFSNTRRIRKEHRTLYRQREDLQAEYPAPFDVSERSLYSWLERAGLMKD
jgi:hypothetical protein